MSSGAADQMERIAERLKAAGAADLAAIGLAGIEPLWPILAEAARLAQPFSGTGLQLFASTEAYAQLLKLLRDSMLSNRS
jgi:hypothetical protein